MRLSEAMALGRVTCELEVGNWNACALGCAANAVGIPQWGNIGEGREALITNYWPWLREKCPCCKTRDRSALTHVWALFDYHVCRGLMTMEQLIDWVRSIEPRPLGLPAPAQQAPDLWAAPWTSTSVDEAAFGEPVAELV